MFSICRSYGAQGVFDIGGYKHVSPPALAFAFADDGSFVTQLRSHR
jgi:hypothetical protein